MVIAALCFPQLKAVKGVELLDGLHEMCSTVIDLYNASAESALGGKVVPMSVVKDDILTLDWSDADIIYASSICFPDELAEGIADKCAELKPGTRILTLKSFAPRPYLQYVHYLKVKFTWGIC